jgi:hypothetical protein
MKNYFGKFVFLAIVCFMAISIMGVFMSCKSIDYPQPSFEKPNTYVIDSASVRGGLEDNVRLYNQTTKTDISFRVYLHDPKKNIWVEYGIGNLKGFGDTDFIKSNLAGELDKYRYFAIEALDGNAYNYNFYKSRDDLYISISDK